MWWAASEPCVICILAFLRQAFSRRLAPSPWKNDKLSFVMVRICTRGKLAEPTYHAYHLISRPPAHFKSFPAERRFLHRFLPLDKNPALDCASVSTRFSKPPKPPKLPKPLTQSPASRPVSLLRACWPARHLGKPRTARSASFWATLTSFRRDQIVSPLLNLILF